MAGELAFDILTFIGEDLDDIGEVYGLQRKPVEPDQVFRERILALIKPLDIVDDRNNNPDYAAWKDI